MQMEQGISRRARPVHHDRSESVLDGRLETAFATIVDVDNVSKRSEDAWLTGQAFYAGTCPGLVECCLQRLGSGLERVGAVDRHACAGLALAFTCLGSLLCRDKLFELDPESLVCGFGHPQLGAQLGQATLMLRSHTIRVGKPLSQSRHRLPGG